MENQLFTMRVKAKELWITYLKETDLSKATKVLKKWGSMMNRIHRLQTSINLLYVNNEENDNNFIQEIIEMGRKNIIGEETLIYV